MKSKWLKLDILNTICYVLYIIVYIIILNFIGVGNFIGNFRYYVLLFIILFSAITIYLKNGKKILDIKKELVFLLITAVTFLVISIIRASEAHIPLNIRTFVQISLWLFPALYALNFIKIFHMKDIYKLLKITTICVIIAYFTESPHTIFDFFKIENWKSINLRGFISFTESSKYAETFLQLFLFFYYFKDRTKNLKLKKSLNVFAIVNFVFIILSFKRLGILFAICIIIYKHTLGKIFSYERDVKFKPAIIFAILFTILTIIYTKFMQGKIFTGIDLYHFTSGRDWILKLWKLKDYLSFGYGSSMLVIDRYLEMDLIQIYLELNFIALFLFAFTFFYFAKNNVYANLIMLYAFLNMLTASSLPHQICWVVMLIVVSCIANNKDKDEKFKLESENIISSGDDNI